MFVRTSGHRRADAAARFLLPKVRQRTAPIFQAVYLAVRYFRHQLEGRSFHIYTDHKPLVYAFR